MRTVVIIAVIAAGALAASCARERTVKIGWDQPAVMPDRYRIFVDEQMVKEIPPPPVDVGCRCLQASVVVARGSHTIKVIAYDFRNGASPAATLTVR
jgi:hypothetical protein